MTVEKYPSILGNFDHELDYDLRIVIDIYSRVIDPTNQSFDWTGFFTWAYLKRVNIEEAADLMLIIRDTLAELREDKENIMKDIDNRSRANMIVLSKKFGGK